MKTYVATLGLDGEYGIETAVSVVNSLSTTGISSICQFDGMLEVVLYNDSLGNLIADLGPVAGIFDGRVKEIRIDTSDPIAVNAWRDWNDYGHDTIIEACTASIAECGYLYCEPC